MSWWESAKSPRPVPEPRQKHPFDFNEFKTPETVNGLRFPLKLDLVAVEKGLEGDRDNIIYVYAREQNPPFRKFQIKVTDFYPWFGVDHDEPINLERELLNVETGFKNLAGDRLKKLYFKHVKAVPELRDNFHRHYEADVLFHLRFKVDKQIRNGVIINSLKSEYSHREIEGW